MSWSNGTRIFLPLARLRKSYRFSSGTIQRLSSSIGLHPLAAEVVDQEGAQLLLFICSGASLILVTGS